MTRFFVSYRSTDSGKVDSIVVRLRSLKDEQNVPRHFVWQDKDNIPPAQDWWEAIVDAIIGCEVFIFMVSRNSVENANCRAELSYARKRNRPIVAVVLEDEFTYNSERGKNDLDYWQYVPDELNDTRIQLLFYEGASFLNRLDTALEHFQKEPDKWEDIPAQRPLDPRPVSDANIDIVTLYDQACDYALRLEFNTAERLFQRLANSNDPEFRSDARQWVSILRNYIEIVQLDAHENTRYRIPKLWIAYTQRFPTRFIQLFDPNGIQARYPSTALTTEFVNEGQSTGPPSVAEDPASEITKDLKESSPSIPVRPSSQRSQPDLPEQSPSLPDHSVRAQISQWRFAVLAAILVLIAIVGIGAFFLLQPKNTPAVTAVVFVPTNISITLTATASPPTTTPIRPTVTVKSSFTDTLLLPARTSTASFTAIPPSPTLLTDQRATEPVLAVDPTANLASIHTQSPTNDYFYIFSDYLSAANNLQPYVYMGDANNDLTMDENIADPDRPGTVIRIAYTQMGPNQYAGIWWSKQTTSCAPGIDLRPYSKLTFWAKTDTVNEQVPLTIQIGGDDQGAGTAPVCQESLNPLFQKTIELSQNWTHYEIDLSQIPKDDLSNVINGFGFTIDATQATTPNGVSPIIFYLDEIRYEP